MSSYSTTWQLLKIKLAGQDGEGGHLKKLHEIK